MATYPTGTYAPASKSAGQVIQPSFFNDPDAEITAVEDGLRNGLQHALTVSTGGLTVSTGNTVLGQNLSVAGASTLATVQAGASTLASLQVSGDSTFVGAVTFSSAITCSTTATFTGPVVIAGAFKWPVAGSTLSGGSTRFDNVTIPSTCVVLEIQSNSTAIAITGFSTRALGSPLCIVNMNAGVAITLLNENANSSETSRIVTGGDKTIAAGTAIWLTRSGSTQVRWRGV